MTATPFSLDDALHSIYEVAGCSARLAAIQDAEQPIRAEFARLHMAELQLDSLAHEVAESFNLWLDDSCPLVLNVFTHVRNAVGNLKADNAVLGDEVARLRARVKELEGITWPGKPWPVIDGLLDDSAALATLREAVREWKEAEDVFASLPDLFDVDPETYAECHAVHEQARKRVKESLSALRALLPESET